MTTGVLWYMNTNRHRRCRSVADVFIGTGDGSEVHYFQTDHLGSTRVVAKVTPTGRIDLDRKDYYPFGKEWTQSGMPTSDNRYTFSGKEQQQLRDQSIHYADFGARYYDSDTGIFLQQDPMAEKYYPIGQYNYCAGNPINRIDFDGNLIIFINGFTANKAQQGTAAYWKKTYSVDFTVSVQAQLDDNNVMYRHGGTGLKVETRMLQGELQAVEDYDIILHNSRIITLFQLEIAVIGNKSLYLHT